MREEKFDVGRAQMMNRQGFKPCQMRHASKVEDSETDSDSAQEDNDTDPFQMGLQKVQSIAAETTQLLKTEQHSNKIVAHDA